MFKPWGSGTLCSNPGFWNSMFEPWVRELYVRTRGLENSMFEPRVRELLPPPPESSNPGFGNSMFEPGVWGTLCWNPGFWFSPSPQQFRTLGSGTLCSNPGFGELYVGTPGSGTPPPPPSGSSNPGFGNSMFRQNSLGGMLHHRSAKGGLRRGAPTPPLFLEACR